MVRGQWSVVSGGRLGKCTQASWIAVKLCHSSVGATPIQLFRSASGVTCSLLIGTEPRAGAWGWLGRTTFRRAFSAGRTARPFRTAGTFRTAGPFRAIGPARSTGSCGPIPSRSTFTRRQPLTIGTGLTLRTSVTGPATRSHRSRRSVGARRTPAARRWSFNRTSTAAVIGPLTFARTARRTILK